MPIIEFAGGRPVTWWDYYSLQFVQYFIVVIAVALILWDVYSEHRDRPSPAMARRVRHRRALRGMHFTSHYVDITCTYTVSGRRNQGNKIALWNEEWQAGRHAVCGGASDPFGGGCLL